MQKIVWFQGTVYKKSYRVKEVYTCKGTWERETSIQRLHNFMVYRSIFFIQQFDVLLFCRRVLALLSY